MASPVQDEAMVALVLQIGLVSAPQIDAARAVQADAQRQGRRMPLADALVAIEALSPMQRAGLEKRMAASGSSSQRIGRYRLLRKLGEGGMGTVHLAEEDDGGRQVAIKVLQTHLAKQPELLARFRREAAAAAKLRHPNIAGALAVGEDAGRHYYAMEYCPGETMDRLIERLGRVPARDSLALVLQVVRGLEYAHAQGFIHRDIKPGNLVVASDGRVRILDLGLSKHLAETETSFLTMAGQAMGTPHYIAPEQARGDSGIDHRADIYSLGATWYHLLTGVTPYVGATAAVIMTKHLNEQVANPQDLAPDIPDDVVEIIFKMMAKEPGDRHADCGVLAQDIELVQRGEAPRHRLDRGRSTIAIRRQRKTPGQRSSSDLHPGLVPRAAAEPSRAGGARSSDRLPRRPPAKGGDGGARRWIVGVAAVGIPLVLIAALSVGSGGDRRGAGSPPASSAPEADRTTVQSPAVPSQPIAAVAPVLARATATAPPPAPTSPPAAATVTPPAAPIPSSPAAIPNNAKTAPPAAVEALLAALPLTALPPATPGAIVLTGPGQHPQSEVRSGAKRTSGAWEWYDGATRLVAHAPGLGMTEGGNRLVISYLCSEPAMCTIAVITQQFPQLGRRHSFVPGGIQTVDVPLDNEFLGNGKLGRAVLGALIDPGRSQRPGVLAILRMSVIPKAASAAIVVRPPAAPEPAPAIAAKTALAAEPATPVPPPARVPAPEAAAVRAAVAVLREELRADYARSAPADRCELARKLLGHAADAPPDRRAAALAEARDQAVLAGDPATAFAAVRQALAGFAGDGSEEVAAIARLEAGLSTPAAAAHYARGCLHLIDDLAAADAHAAAMRLLPRLESALRKAQDHSLLAIAREVARRCSEQATEAPAFTSALRTLATRPDDASANLAAGRFLCWVGADWERGLPHLAKGIDQRLAKMATADLSGAAAPGELAERWIEAAASQSGRARVACLERALHWLDRERQRADESARAAAQARSERIVGGFADLGQMPRSTCVLRAWHPYAVRVQQVCLSGDGRLAVTLGSDESYKHSLRVWDVFTGKEVRRFEHGSFAPHPDGRLLAQPGGMSDIETGKQVVAWSMPAGFAPRDVSADGRLLIACGELGALAMEVPGGREVIRLGAQADGVVQGARLASDSRHAVLLTVQPRGTAHRVIVRELPGGKEIMRAEPVGPAFALTPAGDAVAVAAGAGARLLAIPSGRVIREFTGSGTVAAIACTPCGRWLATTDSEDCSIRLWETDTGRLALRLTGHAWAPTAISFAANGRALVSADKSGQVLVWALHL